MNITKKVRAHLKMRLKGGQATAAPPIGSILGQHRVNMMDFINPFNEATKDRQGEDLTVHISVYEDSTMTWRIVGPATDELIRKALNIPKGSSKPNSEKIPQKLSQNQLEEIARLKMVDTNTDYLESVKKMVAGTARSMGIEIES